MGTQFRVKSNALDHPNGLYVVHLVEIVDENNDEPMASALDNMYVTLKSSDQGALSKSFRSFF